MTEKAILLSLTVLQYAHEILIIFFFLRERVILYKPGLYCHLLCSIIWPQIYINLPSSVSHVL